MKLTKTMPAIVVQNQTADLWESIRDALENRSSDTGTAAEEIADHVQRAIASERLVEGEKIPSERILARLIGVSRPTVSQAIRILVVRGIIESRRGSGTYVSLVAEIQHIADLNISKILDRDNAGHLGEVRLWLEATGVSKAIQRDDKNAITLIDQSFEQMQKSRGDIAAWMSADTQFHTRLIAAAGNPYLTTIFESTHSAFIKYEYRAWIASGKTPEWLQSDMFDEVIDIHRPLVDAIIAGDNDAAQKAIMKHHTLMLKHADL